MDTPARTEPFPTVFYDLEAKDQMFERRAVLVSSAAKEQKTKKTDALHDVQFVAQRHCSEEELSQTVQLVPRRLRCNRV